MAEMWILSLPNIHVYLFHLFNSPTNMYTNMYSGTVRWPVALVLKEVQIGTSIAYKAILVSTLGYETESYLDK